MSIHSSFSNYAPVRQNFLGNNGYRFQQGGKKSSSWKRATKLPPGLILEGLNSCKAEITKLLPFFWKIQKFGTFTSLWSWFNALSSLSGGFTELQVPLWNDCNEYNDAHSLDVILIWLLLVCLLLCLTIFGFILFNFFKVLHHFLKQTFVLYVIKGLKLPYFHVTFLFLCSNLVKS